MTSAHYKHRLRASFSAFILPLLPDSHSFPSTSTESSSYAFLPLSLPHAEGDPNRGVCCSMPARPHYMPHSWTHLRNPYRDIGAGASSSDSYAAVETNGVMGSSVTSVTAGTVGSQDTLFRCRLHMCIFFNFLMHFMHNCLCLFV